MPATDDQSVLVNLDPFHCKALEGNLEVVSTLKLSEVPACKYFDISRKLFGSDMECATRKGWRNYSRAALFELLAEAGASAGAAVGASAKLFEHVHTLNMQGSYISDTDFADLVELVESDALPGLRVLLLSGCSRIGNTIEDGSAAACGSLVRLLRARKDLRVDITFLAMVLRPEVSHQLFGSLNLQELCRVIWIPRSWLSSCSGNSECYDSDDDGEPRWHEHLVTVCKGMSRAELYSKIEEAHCEHFKSL